MSYILDALKKAEEARSRGKAPDLFAVQVAEAPAAGKTIWPWVVAGVLVVNAAALFYWFKWSERTAPADPLVSPWPAQSIPERANPLRESPPAVARAPSPTTPGSAPEPVIPPAMAPRPAKAAEARVPPKKPEIQKPVEGAPLPQPQTGNSPKAAPATAPAEAIAVPSPPQAMVPAPVDAAPEQRPQQFAELPRGIRQEIPKMAVSLHMYSGKAANRLVSINDKSLHEGDEVIPGLKLVEITPDGMIFSYRGFRFRKGIN